ncbi:Uma2 family endonuclease [Streptomyces natalensis]|uniref:Membrane protein n=1 Tax=Streptomyces natalensis ATCC 27448 TaxID=1240678 RepID=A0A0D7CE82_9ACTN|nr:Uma2 family endonuclease [Streptomyces natalensis]KIZ14331.1 membrane protein [Streptomyces natalensis ATCC 27448]
MTAPARTLLDEVDWLMERVPGARFEVMGGEICVTPLPDGAHAEVLSDLMFLLAEAGLHDEATRVLQKLAVWLPSGPYDFAIPDLSVIDDFEGHEVEFNCYDPAIFRLVLEVTSNNYGNELRSKVAAYADARIPVYMIVNRRDDRIHLLTDPSDGTYRSHRVHAPGERVTLPASIGAEVKIDVAAILEVARL